MELYRCYSPPLIKYIIEAVYDKYIIMTVFIIVVYIHKVAM